MKTLTQPNTHQLAQIIQKLEPWFGDMAQAIATAPTEKGVAWLYGSAAPCTQSMLAEKLHAYEALEMLASARHEHSLAHSVFLAKCECEHEFNANN